MTTATARLLPRAVPPALSFVDRRRRLAVDRTAVTARRGQGPATRHDPGFAWWAHLLAPRH